jgi:DNA-binding GntR family transcriptional regulator
LETAPDLTEVAHILEDILPARLLVIEFAARLATRRADNNDIQRLQDITDLLIAAFERGDPVVIAHGFQRWLDALIDASHSVAIRWIANPFLEAYRDIVDRFPLLWILEPSFPVHLKGFLAALQEGDEERIIRVTRDYYDRVDGAFMTALGNAMAQRPTGRQVAVGTPEPEDRVLRTRDKTGAAIGPSHKTNNAPEEPSRGS